MFAKLKDLSSRYLSYWDEASRETGPNAVSAKRAVFIHGALFAATLLLLVIAKAGFAFTAESLSAFDTFCLTIGGSYAVGKAVEAFGKKGGDGGTADA